MCYNCHCGEENNFVATGNRSSVAQPCVLTKPSQLITTVQDQVQINVWLSCDRQRVQLFLCCDQMANTLAFTNMLCLPYLFNGISSDCKLNRFYPKNIVIYPLHISSFKRFERPTRAIMFFTNMCVAQLLTFYVCLRQCCPYLMVSIMYINIHK